MELKPGYKLTEVGVIPDDWNYVRLASVAKLESGHTPSKREPSYWGGPIPWVSLHDSNALEDREISVTAQTITTEGINNSSARLLPQGTVIFSRTATVGKATVLGREMATSQDFANYVCGSQVHNHFLVYLFRNMGRQWKSLMAGSIHNTIYMPVFKRLSVVLPPEPEQRAIAGALSDVDALIGALDQLIAKKRDLKQAAMQQLLTGHQRLPGFAGEWKRTAVSAVAKLITKGATPTSYGWNYVEVGVNFLKAESFGEDGSLVPEKVAFITPQTHEFMRRSQLVEGDILFSIAGVLGRTTIVRRNWLPANINQAMCLLRLRRDSVLDGDYLVRCLASPDIQRRIAGISVQAAQANMSLRDVGDFLINHPGIEEQTAIAEVLSDMDSELAALEQKRDKTRLLKQGMMQELLTGRTRLVES